MISFLLLTTFGLLPGSQHLAIQQPDMYCKSTLLLHERTLSTVEAHTVGCDHISQFEQSPHIQEASMSHHNMFKQEIRLKTDHYMLPKDARSLLAGTSLWASLWRTRCCDCRRNLFGRWFHLFFTFHYHPLSRFGNDDPNWLIFWILLEWIETIKQLWCEQFLPTPFPGKFYLKHQRAVLHVGFGDE